jgi:malate dehydrogenase (oxaloacetate-decarboxylating)(NADP+)
VLIWEASAVAKAAMESGVAQIEIDLDEYKERLERLLSKSREVMRIMINQAKSNPKVVVFPEGHHEKVLRASQIILDEGFAQPVLVGSETRILRSIEEHGLHLDHVTIIDPLATDKRKEYAEELFRMRRRKGVTLAEARHLLRNPTVFGAMMVRLGDADALVAGVSQHYPETIRPALQVIGKNEDVSRVAGLHMMIVKDGVYFFADTTVNIEPTAEELADIAVLSADVAHRFHIEPRIAMLSFSNFGSAKHPFVDKVRRATEIIKRRRPDLMVDGEMQADTAVSPELLAEVFPFSTLEGGANVLIFPDLQSANVAFKLVQRLGGAEAIGPILMGMKKPVHVLQHGSEVKDIVYMTAIAVVDAQEAEREAKGASPEATVPVLR